MDLDDSFTEGLMQRMNARKEYLSKKKSEFSGKKRAVLIDEHQVNSDEPPNKSPKYQSAQTHQASYSPQDRENDRQNEDSNALFVPVNSTSDTRGLAALRSSSYGNEQANNCCKWQSAQSSYSSDNKENTDLLKEDGNSPFVTGLSAPRTKGLAALKKSPFQDEEMDSTSEIQVNKCNRYVFSTNSKDLCSGSKSRLAAIAANIRQWEDDTHKPTLPYKNGALSSTNSLAHTNASSSNSIKCSNFLPPKAAGGLGTLSPCKQGNINSVSVGGGQKKSRVWDEAIAATLENPISSSPAKTIIETSDDFTGKSKDEHVYNNNCSENLKFDCDSNIKMKLSSSPLKPTKVNPKLPEQKSFATASNPLSSVDPAELPLSARKALFENALMNGTPKVTKEITDHTLSVAQRAAMFEKASQLSYRPTKANFNIRTTQTDLSRLCEKSPIKTAQPVAKVIPDTINASPIKDTVPPKPNGNHITFIQQKLNEKCETTQEKGVEAKTSKHEISSLVHQWEKISSSNEKSTLNEESMDFASKEEISDVNEEDSDVSEEASEDECEPNDSKEMDEALFEDEQKEDYADEDSDPLESEQVSLKTEATSVCEKQENPNTASIERARSPSWSGMSSYDSSYCASGSQSGSSVRSYDVNEENQDKKEKNPEVPLLYTVSFYRKQKQETRLTPVRTVVHGNKENSPVSTDPDHTEYIQERIKALQEEILRQQTVISQTSQALNLCSCTVEFSGSMEQVEGERLLLISTQKRQACLNEVSRLKAFGSQGENVADGKGTLTITDLQLPLKREFIASQLEGKLNDTVHYFLCLIRHGAQVIVTQMMSTDDKTTDGALCFTNHIQLQNLPADFSVVFEVYALQTKKEVLSHEKKYHIKREHSKIRLTPKGKKADGKILLPAISSPGGPNAVRSPSFGVVGYTRFTLLNCTKKTFTLDKVPFTSPLEGVLRVKLQLHAEHKIMEKGFLTMFEDVSGFGAWHRRWCALDNSYLSFWKYPDDEHKKEPIAVIDLKQCVTSEVKLAPRDICARPHTLQLVTVRPQEKGDKNTLISRSVNTLTTTKHLLSADTKEERILWCNKLNEALASVRKWYPRALKPVNPT